MSVSHISSHGARWFRRKSSVILLRAVEMFGPDSYVSTESSGVLPSITAEIRDAQNSARTKPGWQ